MSAKDWQWDPLQIAVIIVVYKLASALGGLLYAAVTS